MPKEYMCADCGTMIKSMDDDEIANDVQYHRQKFHNEKLSKADALKMTKPAA